MRRGAPAYVMYGEHFSTALCSERGRAHRVVNIELGSHTATHIVVLHLTGATVHTRRLPSVNAKAWPGARDLEQLALAQSTPQSCSRSTDSTETFRKVGDASAASTLRDHRATTLTWPLRCGTDRGRNRRRVSRSGYPVACARRARRPAADRCGGPAADRRHRRLLRSGSPT